MACIQRRGNIRALTCQETHKPQLIEHWKWSSLSLRERIGVRGNEVLLRE